MAYGDFNLIQCATFVFFAVILCLVSLKGLIGRKPLLISNRGIFVYLILIFLPNTGYLIYSSSRLRGVNPLTWIMAVLPFLLMWFLWKIVKGFTIYGVVDKSFRSILLQSLDLLKVKFREDITGIYIPSKDVTLLVQIVMGMGQIRAKGRDPEKFVPQVVRTLQPLLKGSRVQFDYKPFLLYLGLSVLFLLLSLQEWDLYQRISQ